MFKYLCFIIFFLFLLPCVPLLVNKDIFSSSISVHFQNVSVLYNPTTLMLFQYCEPVLISLRNKNTVLSDRIFRLNFYNKQKAESVVTSGKDRIII